MAQTKFSLDLYPWKLRQTWWQNWRLRRGSSPPPGSARCGCRPVSSTTWSHLRSWWEGDEQRPWIRSKKKILFHICQLKFSNRPQKEAQKNTFNDRNMNLIVGNTLKNCPYKNKNPVSLFNHQKKVKGESQIK